ncbi:hypothetical protein [Robertmurraya andreesenii]|uniref:Phage protein n=1 Tax=Anoxybacillus andreesenii TaxID=1325932 RepID=A0ABT9V216_9BACL|nr:hypothetical protein [Robertmurraya andreesenii]MDQ0154937.1 hypothetical protein [Robertmurraya andreesenii]
MAIVTNLSHCQPYFKAYCAEHGLTDGDEWKTWEYMAWISRKWEDYRRLRGKGRYDSIMESERLEFEEMYIKKLTAE